MSASWLNRSLALHGLMLLWVMMVATSFPVAAQVQPQLSPLLLTAVRFLLAALALLPWLLLQRGWRWPRPREAFSYAALGLCLAGFFAAMFAALRLTSAVTTATLFVSQPAIAFGMLLRIERWRWTTAFTLTLGTAGALLILSGGQADPGGITLGPGELLFLGGCAMSALYAVGSRFLTDQRWIPAQPLHTTFWSLLLGSLLIGLPDLGQLPQFAAALIVRDGLVVAYLALFTTCVTFWILQTMALRLPPSTVAAYGYLSPLMVLLLHALVERQPLTLHYLPGTLLLLLAWLLLLRGERRRVGS